MTKEPKEKYSFLGVKQNENRKESVQKKECHDNRQ